MNDRLNEVVKGSASPEYVAINIEDDGKDDASAYMKDFFENVEIVKTNILYIRNSTKQITDINQQVVLATTSEREHELSSELTPVINETNKKATITKQFLQKLKEETDGIKGSNKAKASEMRIRENLVNTLTRKFIDVMKEYQAAQQKYKTDIKKKVRRQVQIVKPDATAEEIDAVMKAGGGSGDVIKSAILKGDAADSIRNAYMNVADKYQDVLTLEASVAELHQMFVDFALLTEQQGELLDQIEFQVKSAADYIDEGNKNMVEAIDYQKQIRKKQCCCIMLILIILAIVVGVIMAIMATQGAI